MGAASSLTDWTSSVHFCQNKNILMLVRPCRHQGFRHLKYVEWDDFHFFFFSSLIFDIFFLKIKIVYFFFILLFLSLRYLTACRASRRREALQ